MRSPPSVPVRSLPGGSLICSSRPDSAPIPVDETMRTDAAAALRTVRDDIDRHRATPSHDASAAR